MTLSKDVKNFKNNMLDVDNILRKWQLKFFIKKEKKTTKIMI